MASKLTLQVASFTSTITFASKTDQEIGNILLWFISDWADPEPEGLTTAQLNQWRLDQARDRIVEMVQREAQRVRLRELRDAQASIETQATDDTNL